MSRKRKWIAVALVIAAGIFIYQRYRVAPSLEWQGIQAQQLNGLPFQPQQENRSLYIFQFFATWCIDCRRELPHWVGLMPFMEKQNIGFYLLSDEKLSSLKYFEETLEKPMLFRLDRAFKEYGVYTLPTVLVYNPKGEIVFSKTGSWTPNENELIQLLR
jgi:hypothetical protein